MTRREAIHLLIGVLAGALLWSLIAPRVTAAPRPAASPTTTPWVRVSDVEGQRTGVPQERPSRAASGAPSRAAVPPVAPIPSSPPAKRRQATVRQPAATSPAVTLHGIASWGDGWVGVVTRLPRGTAIRVCGPLACWSGRSTGYGPAASTGRIADLSRAVFAAICGDPSLGLCMVEVHW